MTAPGQPAPEEGQPAPESQPAPTADFPHRLRSAIRDVPDYPSQGVLFRDITPLLADAALFADAITRLAAGHAAGDAGQVDAVAGVEARGFILAAPVAHALGVGFVPVRKAGKLPHTTSAAQYELEYGSATIEIHTDAVRPGQRVLLVDDVLATGGTAQAAVRLIEGLGAQVVTVAFLIELAALRGRARLPNHSVRSVLVY